MIESYSYQKKKLGFVERVKGHGSIKEEKKNFKKSMFTTVNLKIIFSRKKK